MPSIKLTKSEKEFLVEKFGAIDSNRSAMIRLAKDYLSLSEVVDFRADQNEMYKKEISELEQALFQSSKETEKAEISSLEHQEAYNHALQDLEVICKEIDKKDACITYLETCVTNKDTEIEQTKFGYEQIIKDIRVSLERKDARIKHVEACNETLNQGYERFQDENVKLKADIRIADSMRINFIDLATEHKELEERVLKLTQENVKVADDCEKIRLQHNEVAEKYNALLQDFNERSEDVDHLQKLANRRGAVLSALNKSICEARQANKILANEGDLWEKSTRTIASYWAKRYIDVEKKLIASEQAKQILNAYADNLLCMSERKDVIIENTRERLEAFEKELVQYKQDHSPEDLDPEFWPKQDDEILDTDDEQEAEPETEIDSAYKWVIRLLIFANITGFALFFLAYTGAF